MRLHKGEAAKLFSVKDSLGQVVNLKQCQGKRVLLSFYHYASCPLCNLRLDELVAHYPQYKDQELEIIIVFHSPANSVKEKLLRDALPFRVIADPKMKLYTLYGVEQSWIALIKTLVTPHGVREVMKAAQLGYMSMPLQIDGPINEVPADFLITPDLKLYTTFYGSDISDHIPFSQIDEFLEAA